MQWKHTFFPWLQCGMIMLSIFMIIYGIWNGEAGNVFHKAVRICLECIGIG